MSAAAFPPSPLDSAALQRLEQAQRSAVLADPSDTTARLALAWCLLIRALVRAGQERLLLRLVEADGQPDRLEAAVAQVLEQDAGALLDDCRRQALIAGKLSADPLAEWHAERLQELAALPNAAAPAEGLPAALAALTRDLLAAAPPAPAPTPPRPGRRGPSRPAPRARRRRLPAAGRPPAG